MDFNANRRQGRDIIYDQNTSLAVDMTNAVSGKMSTLTLVNITLDIGDDDKELEEASLAWMIFVPLVVGSIVIVTVIGNAFVVLAYWRDRRIHSRVANLLIVNLAISDFIVGLIVLSVNLAWITWVEVLGVDVWLLGETFCKVWLVIDNTATLVSVLTIILISLDRYWLLSKKLRYNSFQTRKRVSRTLAVIWIATATVYFVVTFAWTPITGESVVDFTVECELDMTYNVHATVVQLFMEFVIPLGTIIVLNMIVYVKIRKRAKGLKRLGRQKTLPSLIVTKECRIEPEGKSSTSGASVVTASNITLAMMDSNLSLQQDTVRHQNESTLCETGADHERSEHMHLDSADYCRQHSNSREQLQHHQEQRQKFPPVRAEQQQRASHNAHKNTSQSQKSRREFARQRRSAVVLAVLVSVFIACWLPYQIVNVINALCGGECISYLAWEIVNNILWCNSLINPFLYAATNVHFRRNFIVFLGLKRLRCTKSTLKVASRPSSTVEVVRRRHPSKHGDNHNHDLNQEF